MPSTVANPEITWRRDATDGDLVRTLVPDRASADMEAVVRRAAQALGAPVALLSLLDEHEETFAASSGLPVALATAARMPATWAFCQRVCQSRSVVVVEDAHQDPVFASNPLTEAGLVRSYAGAPVEVDGCVVGAMCVVSPEPRSFTASDLECLEDAARLASQWLAANRRATPASPRTPDRDVGLLVADRWRIFGHLGGGGQGDVWVARESGSGRDVAVKIAPTSHGSVMEEARAFAAVRHHNLVNVHAAGRLEDGREYAVMEFIDGEPFAQHVRVAGQLDMELLLERVSSVAGALTSLHGAGWVHGDVKCSNVLIDRARDRAVVIDLGLGIRLDQPMARAGGTPGVSAPEQFNSALPPVGRAADVYGLAIMVWQILAGQSPFDGFGTAAEAIAAQHRGLPLDLHLPEPELASVETVLRGALHPNPEDRPRTPLSLVFELRQATDGQARIRPPGGGVAIEVFRAVYRTLEPATLLLPRLVPFERVQQSARTHISAQLWLDFLEAVSGDDASVIRDLIGRSVRTGGRQRIRSSHLSFDTQAVVESMVGHFEYFVPAYHLRLRVTESGARGHVELPAGRPDLFQAHLEAFFVEMLALTGAMAEVHWEHEADRRWAVSVVWEKR